MEMNTNATDNNSIAEELFHSAMKGEWDKVVEIYRQDSAAYKAKITRSGDTALHVAVSNIKVDIVEELVSIIKQNGSTREALKVTNERGNTALHIAASVGNWRICNCIAEVDHSLIGVRNLDNETPLFVAALHGKKDAFLCLNAHLESNPELRYSYSRNKDGQTILHCAISGYYFDLAFQIIHLYERLVNSEDKDGLSPLHILASKPTAFRSGCHLGWGRGIIYHGIFVDDLKVDFSPTNMSKEMQSMNYPDNYQTCIHFLKLLKRLVKLVFGSSNCMEKDEENPQGQQLLPLNYRTCFDFVKLVSKAMLIVFGLGSRRIKKLEEKKKKHKWSVQVMNELLNRASDVKHKDNGISPLSPSEVAFEGEAFLKNDHPQQQFMSSDNDQNQEQNGYKALEIEVEGDDEKKEGISEMKEEMSILIAAKGGTTEMVEKIQKLCGVVIHDMNSEKKNKVLLAVERRQPHVYQRSITKETPFLSAAKCGITEMVEKILEVCPVAIHDMNSEKRNMVLLAVESQQPHVYQRNIMKETPILIAARYGITEMVGRILEVCPTAIQDINSEKKNIALLAAENRQPQVLQLLLQQNNMKESIFGAVDANGNSALHLAAILSDLKPWRIPGAALQMQWEIKWYKFVKNSMPSHLLGHYNKQGKTPKDIFSDTHSDLVEKGGKWLTSTSESCSVVAALIATVAFATSSAVPGGSRNDGKPNMESQPAFNVFAFSSITALCFSITALVMFLVILTSRYQERDFMTHLPKKLLFGLTSLFVSIASMLVSFCAGHFLILKENLKYAAFPVYAVTCLPVTLFAAAQFPLYFDLARATLKKVPQRSYRAVSP
ncbi:hypothetical protein SLEP1_g58484 [Rubroshorea leprosula]|uniref:PGG domain-containing protein n=1 Tax=Rubroshorea leprosula TaxID=152421 RepID=A0AAV5MPF4_9ROSI|nr:hypothetical protein SLEP1_g58484 [Rubroshorea leprosula]